VFFVNAASAFCVRWMAFLSLQISVECVGFTGRRSVFFSRRSGFNFLQGAGIKRRVGRYAAGHVLPHTKFVVFSFNFELASVLLVKKWLFVMFHDCMDKTLSPKKNRSVWMKLGGGLLLQHGSTCRQYHVTMSGMPLPS
jgi:hypothetical protein